MKKIDCKFFSEKRAKKECSNCKRKDKCYSEIKDNYTPTDKKKKKKKTKTKKKKKLDIRDIIRKIGKNVEKFEFSEKKAIRYTRKYELKFKNLAIETNFDIPSHRYFGTILHISNENIPLKYDEEDFLRGLICKKIEEFLFKELVEENKKIKEDFKEGTKSLNLIKFN